MSSLPTLNEKEIMAKGVSYIAAAAAIPDIADLYQRIIGLHRIVDSLRSDVDYLKREVKDMRERTLPRQVFPLPSDEIVESVASYLKERREAYPSDIADKLGISIREVMSAISILREAKKVGEA